jgi:acetylornithine deacetylase/succinyl-diaminopimelate desuccinylase-like protein
MHAYFEYHIEQGPILEAEHKQIGVVTHGQGLWWLEFTLTGKEAHTGSTPMQMRVNAGLAMARIIELVQAVAMERTAGRRGRRGAGPRSRRTRATCCRARWCSPSTSARPTGQARPHARTHRGRSRDRLRGARRRLRGRGRWAISTR